MGGDKKLTCAGIAQFIPLQFPANVHGIFRSEIIGIGACSIGALNDNTFGFDHELCEFFLG